MNADSPLSVMDLAFTLAFAVVFAAAVVAIIEAIKAAYRFAHAALRAALGIESQPSRGASPRAGLPVTGRNYAGGRASTEARGNGGMHPEWW